MKKISSLLIITAAVMMLAVSFAPMLNSTDGNGGDNALSEKNFTGYIEISTPAQLAKIGKESGYPLNGKYYLANHIDLSGINTNGGKDVYVSITIESGLVVFTLRDQNGNSLPFSSTNPLSLYIDGNFKSNANLSRVTADLSTIASGKHSVVLCGSTTISSVKCDFAYEMNITTSGTASVSPSSVNFSTNGNFTPIENFTGIFDGNGYKISGLDIRAFSSSASTMYVGLFGNISTGAKVLDLGVVDGSVLAVSNTAAKIEVGGIVGESLGNIENCYNENNITAYGTRDVDAGGVAGCSKNYISKCYNKGNITVMSDNYSGAGGGSYIGGIAGHLEWDNTVIKSSYNTGNIFANRNHGSVFMGGIVGYSYSSNTLITDCYNRGNMNGYGEYMAYAGGIVANAYHNVTIANCYNTGMLTAETGKGYPSFTGGTVAYSQMKQNIKIYNCYYQDGTATGVALGEATVDDANGSSSPARKINPDQRSGFSKTAAQMKPSLTEALKGNSIYYVGTTGGVKGWNFEDEWTIIPGVNDNYPVLNRTAKVYGTVTANNVPLAGAEIKYTIDGVEWDQVLTDASGKYMIGVPVGYLFEFTNVVYAGYVPVEEMPEPFTASIDRKYDFAMKLDPNAPFTITGKVTLNNDPVAGVDINYTLNGAPGVARTESDGTYVIDTKRDNEVIITEVVTNNTLYKANDHPYGTFIMTQNFPDTDFTLRYDESLLFKITGTVTFNNIGIPEAKINFTGGIDPYVETDNEGKYIITAAAGSTIKITSVEKTGFVQTVQTQPEFFMIEDHEHDIEMGAESGKLFEISGKVTNKGNGVKGVTITFTGCKEDAVLTEADGTYSVLAEPGASVTIKSVVKDGFTVIIPQPPISFVILEDRTYDFVLDAVPGHKFTITGKVTFTDGTPLKGVSISYTGTSGSPVSTDEDGEYVIDAFAGETVTITGVTKDGFNVVGELPKFFMDDDKTHDFEMTAQGGETFTVTGTVTVNGKPLSGVTITSTGSTSASVSTDVNGKYTITANPGATVKITGVTKNGFEVDGDLPEFFMDEDKKYDFAMKAKSDVTFTITGTVKFGGISLPGVTITSTGSSQPSVETNEKGEYSIEAVPGATVTITGVTKDGFIVVETLPQLFMDTDKVQNFTMTADPAHKFTITGKVTFTDGTPLKDVTITSTGSIDASVTTDQDGEYIIYAYAGQTVTVTGVTKTGFTVTTELPAWVMIDDVEQDFEMDALPGHEFTVYGTVTLGPKKIPLKDVTITFEGCIGTSVPTDQDGKYTIRAHAGETVKITAVTKTGFKFNGDLPECFMDRDHEHDFEMEAVSDHLFTLSGMVKFGGRPLSGVTIEHTGTGSPFTTIEDGKYSIDAYAGETLTISVVDKEYFNVSVALPMDFFMHDDIEYDFEMLPDEGKYYSISGKVTFTDGTPLKKVTISYTDGIVTSTETDEEGKYIIWVIPTSDVTITAVTKKGFIVEGFTEKNFLNVNDHHYDLDFVMSTDPSADRFKIYGTVTYDGITLKGVEIVYSGAADSPFVTLGDGKYVIYASAGANVSITGVNKDGFLTDGLPMEFFMDDDIEQNFEMEPIPGYPFRIFGTVTSAGNPLYEVSVSYSGSRGAALTDEDGGYEIIAYAGTTVSITGVNKNGFTVTTALPTLMVMTDDIKYDFEMDPVPGYKFTITGKVTFTDGTPLFGVMIYYSGTDGSPVETNKDGEYVINAYAGETVTITNVIKNGFKMDGISLPEFYMDDDHEWDFEMIADKDVKFTISGKVTFTDGTPLNGVTITSTGSIDVSVRTNEKGEYTITAYPGATVTIDGVTKYGFKVSGDLPSLFMDSNKTYDFEMTADSGVTFTISGVVKFGTNTPLFMVVITSTSGIDASVTTDKDGKYVIEASPGSTVKILGVDKDGFIVSGELPKFFMDKDHEQNFEMTADPSKKFTIYGYVTFGIDIPLNGVTITYSNGKDTLTVTTNSYGYYIIYASPGETIAITGVTKTGFEMNGGLPEFFMDDDFEQDFVMTALAGKEFKISGIVTFTGGTPLKNVEITYTGGINTSVGTNSAGYYEIFAYPGQTVKIEGVAKPGFEMKDELPKFFMDKDFIHDFEMTAESGVTFKISGIVTFGNSTPLKGVLITYTGGIDTSVGTNSEGYYEIFAYPGQTVTIKGVTKDGFEMKDELPKFFMDDDFIHDFEMTADPDARFMIHGVITINGTGVPLKGVTVVSKNGIDMSVAVTDEKGEYKIFANAGDTVLITGVTKDGFLVNVMLPMEFFMDGNIEQDLEMDPVPGYKFTISGVVTFQGIPLEGVTISYDGGIDTSVTTDENGKYTIFAYAGETVEITGVDKDGFIVVGGLPVFLMTENIERNFVMVADNGAMFDVSGTVTFNGAPAGGIVVSYKINGVPGQTATDGDGHYVIPVNAGDEFEFVGVGSANGALKATEEMPEAFFVTDDRTENFTLAYDTSVQFTISGTVTFSGKAMDGIVITYNIGSSADTVTTANGGKYSITANAGDEFEFIGVMSSDSVYMFSGTLPKFTVSGNETHDFALGYNPSLTFTISGTVKKNGTQNGNGALGATGSGGIAIWYKVNGGEPQKVLTDGEGNYVIVAMAGDMVEIVEIETGEDYGLSGGLPDPFHMITDHTHDFDLHLLSTGGGVPGWFWWLIPAFLTFCILLFLFMRRFREEEEEGA